MEYHRSYKKLIHTSKYFDKMMQFVETEKNLCPTADKVFRFMNCDLENAKCVILGMDPYPSIYKKGNDILPVATGRAFEVANVKYFTDKYKQLSLINIFKALCYYKHNKIYTMNELRNIYKNDKSILLDIHNWFDNMEKQGVVFLNATLTTKIGKTGAHISIWTDFMDEVITYIAKNENIKWLIWGDSALKRVKNIIDKSKIIYSCHPASRANNNFVNDCCFKKIKNVKWF